MKSIKPFIADLEARIDPECEVTIWEQWQRFCDTEETAGLFVPARENAAPPSIEWPQINVNAAIENWEEMLLQQLSGCSRILNEASGEILHVRANYGTGILPSLFGADMFVMDEKLDTLPTTRPLRGGMDEIKRLLDTGMPDLRAGYGARVLDMGACFSQMFDENPGIARFVHVCHPDLQGPMDVCDLLWGSEIFLDMIDEPDLVRAFLDLITDTYIAFMKAWRNVAPDDGATHAVHWGLLHKGRIMLRDDSAMNVSPEMFAEFIQPWDQRALNELGGGAIHFCGRGDHYIKYMPQMEGLHAINMSQPQYNDMDVIYQHTIDQGIKLIGLDRTVAEEAQLSGRELHGNIHS